MEDLYIGLLWIGLVFLQFLQLLALLRLEARNESLAKTMAQAMAYIIEARTPKKLMKPCKSEEHLWKRDQKGEFYCEKCGEKP